MHLDVLGAGPQAWSSSWQRDREDMVVQGET